MKLCKICGKQIPYSKVNKCVECLREEGQFYNEEGQSWRAQTYMPQYVKEQRARCEAHAKRVQAEEKKMRERGLFPTKDTGYEA